MAEFKCECIPQGRAQIVRTQGYLDDAGGKILKDLCTKAIDAGNTLFVFNLAGTPVINSTGLSMMLDLIVKVIDYNDGKVGITGLSKLTRTALQMTGVLTLAQEYPNEEEAVKAVSA